MDAQFLSADYLEAPIPKDRAYLQRYFATEMQGAFLRYMLAFGDWKNFIEHTGHYCSKRTLQVLQQKLRSLEEAHRTAKTSMDFDTLESIESGHFRDF